VNSNNLKETDMETSINLIALILILWAMTPWKTVQCAGHYHGDSRFRELFQNSLETITTIQRQYGNRIIALWCRSSNGEPTGSSLPGKVATNIIPIDPRNYKSGSHKFRIKVIEINNISEEEDDEHEVVEERFQDCYKSAEALIESIVYYYRAKKALLDNDVQIGWQVFYDYCEYSLEYNTVIHYIPMIYGKAVLPAQIIALAGPKWAKLLSDGDEFRLELSGAEDGSLKFEGPGDILEHIYTASLHLNEYCNLEGVQLGWRKNFLNKDWVEKETILKPLINNMYVLPADLIALAGGSWSPPSATRYQLSIYESGLPMFSESITIIYRASPSDILDYIHADYSDENYELCLGEHTFQWLLRDVAERTVYRHQKYYHAAHGEAKISPSELIGRAGGKWRHLLQTLTPV
jgi:hypothetical protein